MPESLAADVRLAGFEVRTLASGTSPIRSQQDDAADVLALLAEFGGADVVIVDHYDLDADWERAVSASGPRIAVIDDLADRPHDCALLLDQNLYDDADSRYLGLVPEGCRLLLGPRWALLRSEFVTAAAAPRPRTGDISRVLISYGGADPTHETEKALAALADVSSIEIIDVVVGAAFSDVWRVRAAVGRDSRCAIHEQPSDLAGLMSDADLALGAGGSTTWERCALGLPAIVTSVASNQVEAARTLARHGAILYAGDAGDVGSADLRTAVRALVADPLRVKQMGIAARSVIGRDYEGATGVAAAILEVARGNS